MIASGGAISLAVTVTVTVAVVYNNAPCATFLDFNFQKFQSRTAVTATVTGNCSSCSNHITTTNVVLFILRDS